MDAQEVFSVAGPRAAAAPDQALAALEARRERIEAECRPVVDRAIWGDGHIHHQQAEATCGAIDAGLSTLRTRVRDHLSDPNKSKWPINVFELYFELMTAVDRAETRRDALATAPPLPDPERAFFYAQQCAACYQMCLDASSSTIPNPPTAADATLAILYMMREGVEIHHNSIIPTDPWLSHHLPPLKTITTLGFKKKRYTLAKRFISAALSEAIKNRPLATIRIGMA